MVERADRFESLEAARGSLQDAVSIGFVDYFVDQLKKHAGRIPCERDMLRGGLFSFQPYIAVMDCRDAIQPCFRMAGERYIEYFGQDPTGRKYLDFVPEHRVAAALEAFGYCVGLPCAMVMQILGVSSSGQERITETVGVPVAQNETGRAAFIYLTSIELMVLGKNDDAANFSKRAEVKGRHFVDIGYGCPEKYLGNPLT